MFDRRVLPHSISQAWAAAQDSDAEVPETIKSFYDQYDEITKLVWPEGCNRAVCMDH